MKGGVLGKLAKLALFAPKGSLYANPTYSSLVPTNPTYSSLLPTNYSLVKEPIHSISTPYPSLLNKPYVSETPQAGPLPVVSKQQDSFVLENMYDRPTFTSMIQSASPTAVKKWAEETIQKNTTIIFEKSAYDLKFIGGHNSLTTQSREPIPGIEIAGANQFLSFDAQLFLSTKNGVGIIDLDTELQPDGTALSYHGGLTGSTMNKSEGGEDTGKNLKKIFDTVVQSNTTIVLRMENNGGFSPKHFYEICKRAKCDMSALGRLEHAKDSFQRGKVYVYLEHDMDGFEIQNGLFKDYNIHSQSHRMVRLHWDKTNEIMEAKTVEDIAPLLLFNKEALENGMALLLIDFYRTAIGAWKKGLITSIQQFFLLIHEKIPLIKQYLREKHHIDTGEGAIFLVDGQTVENYLLTNVLNILPKGDKELQKIVLDVLKEEFIENSLLEQKEFREKSVFIDHYIPFVKNIEKLMQEGKSQWSSNTQNTMIVGTTIASFSLSLVYLFYKIIQSCRRKKRPIPDNPVFQSILMFEEEMARKDTTINIPVSMIWPKD